jgi:hypothetical protein
MRIAMYQHVTCKQEDASNLFFAEYSPGLVVDIETAREIVANRLEFTGGEDHYVVIDLTNVKSVTAEAKEFMQSPEGGLQKILGAAFFANNPVASLIANVYVKTPTNFESRFFSTKEEATAWIRSCMIGHSNGNN